jgi:hypothetical protein
MGCHCAISYFRGLAIGVSKRGAIFAVWSAINGIWTWADIASERGMHNRQTEIRYCRFMIGRGRTAVV